MQFEQGDTSAKFGAMKKDVFNFPTWIVKSKEMNPVVVPYEIGDMNARKKNKLAEPQASSSTSKGHRSKKLKSPSQTPFIITKDEDAHPMKLQPSSPSAYNVSRTVPPMKTVQETKLPEFDPQFQQMVNRFIQFEQIIPRLPKKQNQSVRVAPRSPSHKQVPVFLQPQPQPANLSPSFRFTTPKPFFN